MSRGPEQDAPEQARERETAGQNAPAQDVPAQDVPAPDAPAPDARRDIVAAARELAALGLSPGRSGNVSVRVGDRVHIAATGCDLATLGEDGLAVADLSGRHLQGPRPSKELPLHLAFYRRDPECAAVVHLHSRQAAAASCLPPWSASSALPPISPYYVMRVGQTPLVPYAPPGDDRQAAVIEQLGIPFRAVLLQNHGPVVSGRTVAEASAAAVEIEEASALTLLTRGADRRPLSDEAAAELARTYGTAWTGVVPGP